MLVLNASEESLDTTGAFLERVGATKLHPVRGEDEVLRRRLLLAS